MHHADIQAPCRMAVAAFVFTSLERPIMTKSITDTVSTAQADLEKLVGDLRGLLSAKELDAVPEIHLLRQRIDDGMSNVRDSAVRAAQEAARQAKDAAYAADRYAHDEPWRVAGAALAVGALLGFMLGRR
jgi:ElaB/YqjD/DUF883 family membrane-anchored ribosome-binding protein